MTEYKIKKASSDLVLKAIKTVPLPVMLFKAGLLAKGIPECRYADYTPEAAEYFKECIGKKVIPRSEVTIEYGTALLVNRREGLLLEYKDINSMISIWPTLRGGETHQVEISIPTPAKENFERFRKDFYLDELVRQRDYQFEFASIWLSDKGKEMEENGFKFIQTAGVYYEKGILSLQPFGLEGKKLEKTLTWFNQLKEKQK